MSDRNDKTLSGDDLAKALRTELERLSKAAPFPIHLRRDCIEVQTEAHRTNNAYLGREMAEYVFALVTAHRSGKLVASTGSEEETKGASASPIQIREGACYRNAAGERIGPMFRIKGDAAQVWYAKGQRGDWAPDGQALHSFPRDNLVAEWPTAEEAAR